MPTPEVAPARARRFALAFAVLLFAPPATAQPAQAPPRFDPPPAAPSASVAEPAQAIAVGPAPRIGLVTMEPGDVYWSRFGHNAILVDDGRSPTLYNYGYFDFEQPGFLTRFLRGRMLYRLLALPLQADLRNYAAEGRGVELQWLDVGEAQARELARFLRWNALPENADYRYDYFTANCSTKVRDALDRAFGGALQRELSGRSHGFTFRDEAQRLAGPLPWLYLGIHLGLGPFTDRPLSLWDESFVPGRLRDALQETRLDGRPVVLERVRLLPHALGPGLDAPPAWRVWFMAAGLGLAGLLLWGLRAGAGRAVRRATATLAALTWTACGLVGVGLLLLWCCTDHLAAWGNENALLFNPLCLLLLAGVPALARGGRAPPPVRVLSTVVLLCAGAALFLKFLPFRIQSNGDWIALLLPVHAALAWRLARTDPAR